MIVESIVLHRNKSILEVFGDFIDANRTTILRRMDIRNLISMNIVDLR